MKYTNNQAAMNEIRRLNRESATKGVEDGMSDERFSAKQRVLAKYPQASWDSIMGVWPNDSTGLKGCLGIGHTEMEAWDSADRALAAFEPKPDNQGDITEILHSFRSATPEELAAQRESLRCFHCDELPEDHRALPGSPLCPREGRKPFSEGEWRTTHYKPGPRQATPFMPSEPATKPVKNALGMVVCTHCLKSNGEHNTGDECIDNRGHLLGTDWEPLVAPSAAVPVEERTADKMQPRFGNCNHRTGDGDTAVDIYGVCTHCGQIMQGSVQLSTSFIPEERTAEIEQLMGTIEKALNASRIALDSNTLARRLLAISMIEKGWAAIAAIKRDHIEGKAK